MAICGFIVPAFGVLNLVASGEIGIPEIDLGIIAIVFRMLQALEKVGKFGFHQTGAIGPVGGAYDLLLTGKRILVGDLSQYLVVWPQAGDINKTGSITCVRRIYYQG